MSEPSKKPAKKATRPAKSAFASGAARASGERRRRTGTPLIGLPDAAVPAESAQVTTARREHQAQAAAAEALEGVAVEVVEVVESLPKDAADRGEASAAAPSAAPKRAAKRAASGKASRTTAPKKPPKKAVAKAARSEPDQTAKVALAKTAPRPTTPAPKSTEEAATTAGATSETTAAEQSASAEGVSHSNEGPDRPNSSRRPKRSQVSSTARRGGLQSVPSGPDLEAREPREASADTGRTERSVRGTADTSGEAASDAAPRRSRPARSQVTRSARPAASGRTAADASKPRTQTSDSARSGDGSDSESTWSLARASKLVGQVLEAAEVSSKMRPSAGDVVEMVVTLLRSAAAAAGLDTDAAEEQIAQTLAYLRRRLTGDYEVDEFGFDADFTDHVQLPLLRPLYRKWFRVEVKGIENIPTEGGALIVANHSGTVALDSLMTQVAVHDETPNHRNLRMLGADLVFQTPFIGTIARRSGSTLAATSDAERLFAKGELVGVWPEGFKGVGKPFSERYKLQRFGRGGFVSAALRSQVPIIPCSIVGAEEIYPIIGNMPTVARLLGLPYAPITPTFPLLGPLGLIPLPSKWLIEFGPPIATDTYAPEAADDPMLVFDLTDQVRETIQQTLYSLLMQRKSVFI